MFASSLWTACESGNLHFYIGRIKHAHHGLTINVEQQEEIANDLALPSLKDLLCKVSQTHNACLMRA